MARAAELVGRDHELAELAAALSAARNGRGGLVLLSGEAGVGKTRLAEEALARGGLLVLHGAASQQSTPPYGPFVAALRSYLRDAPGGLDDCGPLTPQLSLVLPELGPVPRSGDTATLVEAIRCALTTIANECATAVFIDDLHWADEASLVEVLPSLAAGLEDQAVLVVAADRNDEIPRGHPLRRLRRELRRAGRLRELLIEPLDLGGTAAIATQVLGVGPSPSLAAELHDRTQGVPFFVEELAAALAASDRLIAGKRGLRLADGGALPIPDSIREATLLRTAGLSHEARSVLEAAAVAGLSFELDLIADVVEGDGLGEALECGVIAEAELGRATFRHALTREALYGDVPWTRRRALHRLIAERLEQRAAPSGLVAEHWLAARDLTRACPALVAAAEESAAVHAYRDALHAARRAAEIWPDAEDEEGRLALVEQIGVCGELCGELAEAATAWRELADRRRAAGDPAGSAEALRRLATAYELQGAAERALAARRDAAAAFSRTNLPGEAAAELLAVAAHLDSAGSLAAALEVVEWAANEAKRARRRDLQARALGVEGTIRAKLGQLDAGLESARSGLELALAEDMTAPAVEAYQRLANVLENASDYRAAWDAYQEAYGFCEDRGAHAAAQICLVCLAAILFFTGEWERATALDHEILASAHASAGVKMGAKQHLGLIGAATGDPKRARRLLDESGAYAERFERQRMEVWDALGHAWIDEAEGADDGAVQRCRFMLARWGDSESVHYPVPALRWSATFLATHGAEADARSCAAALAGLARATVNPEALAGLAHGIGEVALLDGDPERAAEQFEKALALLQPLALPFEAAQTQVRAGVALAAAGDREGAVDRLTTAYRTARKLGARPPARRAAGELEALGEQVERRLGRRAAAELGGTGLTRREFEVLRLVADGKTNREIARELFLSMRTVDMHVRNILRKLDCRSRLEATRKAGELGLIG